MSLILFTQNLVAQKVPSTLRFANMRIDINAKARAEIQKDVDKLIAPSEYLTQKLARAKQYFPIIERVFRETNFPDDFKYLVLQESSLISNAVSKSNAIGFWQFKKPAALEVGLVINKHVDHRMNIIYATRGAAKYITKNNKHFFNNWLLALQAYQMGPGAVRRSKYAKDVGKNRMKITPRTYWYVKKFLAHKVAFEYALSRNDIPFTPIRKYKIDGEHSFKDISRNLNVSSEVLKEYNHWIKSKRFHLNGETVFFPSDTRLLSSINHKKKEGIFDFSWIEIDFASIFNRDIVKNEALFNAGVSYPMIAKNDGKVFINNKRGIFGEAYSTFNSLALRGGILVSQFLEYNDMTIKDTIQKGQVYYFEKKDKRQKHVKHYIVRENETLWSISQKFGIQLDKLVEKNRLSKTTKIKKGLILWLKKRRPKKKRIEYYNFPNEKPNKKVEIKKIINTPISTSPELKKLELEPEKPDLEPEKPDLESEKPDLEPEKPDLESEKVEVKPELIEYKIKQGDTLYSIARRYNVSVNHIIQNNKNISPQQLKPGTILKIPKL